MAPPAWTATPLTNSLAVTCGAPVSSVLATTQETSPIGMVDFSISVIPPYLEHDFVTNLIFYVITCCTGAFLCMLVGCRMNVLRCSKEIKNPPLLFLALLICALMTYGGNLLLQHLINSGVVGACRASALYPLVVTTLQKFCVFFYFIEVMHALRACNYCGQEMCKLASRWRHDFVWLIYLVVLVLGTVAEIVHISAGRQVAKFLTLNSCVITESTSLTLHLLLWRLAYSLLLGVGFFCLAICTVAHWPVLNDVSSWQYAVRTCLFRFLPSRVKHTTNEQFGADHPLKCSAYLTPINGRTAGVSERSAFATLFTVLLTIVPTAGNLGLLVGFDGTEKSWLSFLSSNLDACANVVLIFAFSTNVTEHAEDTRQTKLQAIQQDCSHHHPRNSHCCQNNVALMPRTSMSVRTSAVANPNRCDGLLATISTAATQSNLSDRNRSTQSPHAKTFSDMRFDSKGSTLNQSS